MSRNTLAYRVGGRRVPSVTEALALSGVVDLSAIPEGVLEAARQRGSDVHGWLEALDLGLLDDDQQPDDRIEGYVRAYARFRIESGFVPRRIEEVVIDEINLFAGTIDRTGTMRGGREVLVDIKTSQVIGPEVGLQLAGYALALDPKAERTAAMPRFALQLTSDGTYALREFRERSDFHDFLSCVRLAHWKLRHRRAALEE